MSQGARSEGDSRATVTSSSPALLNDECPGFYGNEVSPLVPVVPKLGDPPRSGRDHRTERRKPLSKGDRQTTAGMHGAPVPGVRGQLRTVPRPGSCCSTQHEVVRRAGPPEAVTSDPRRIRLPIRFRAIAWYQAPLSDAAAPPRSPPTPGRAHPALPLALSRASGAVDAASRGALHAVLLRHSDTRAGPRDPRITPVPQGHGGVPATCVPASPPCRQTVAGTHDRPSDNSPGSSSTTLRQVRGRGSLANRTFHG